MEIEIPRQEFEGKPCSYCKLPLKWEIDYFLITYHCPMHIHIRFFCSESCRTNWQDSMENQAKEH